MLWYLDVQTNRDPIGPIQKQYYCRTRVKNNNNITFTSFYKTSKLTKIINENTDFKINFLDNLLSIYLKYHMSQKNVYNLLYPKLINKNQVVKYINFTRL